MRIISKAHDYDDGVARTGVDTMTTQARSGKTHEQGNLQMRCTQSQSVYEGDAIRVAKHRFEGRHGANGKPLTLHAEVMDRGDCAAVLPYDSASAEVVLIEQFRAGVWAANRTPWVLECVAGMMDRNESAQEAARREAREEAGCELGWLAEVGTYWTCPPAMTERMHIFIGEVKSHKTQEYFGAAEEGECTRVVRMQVKDAVEAVRAGTINDMKTVLAIEKLARDIANVHRFMESEKLARHRAHGRSAPPGEEG